MADYKMYAFFTAEGEGKAGLTVTVTVYDSAGNVKVASGSATGLAGGMYRYTHTDTTADDYIAVFKTTDTTVDAKHIPAMVSKQQPMVEDVKAKTDNLPASPAAVGSAMTLADGAVTAAKLGTGAITADKIAASAITDAKIATDAISAAKVKADAVTKIQSGLATSANLQTVDDNVDAIKAKTDNLPASPAAVGSAMTLTAAYDKAKDDVLTPLGVVDGIVDGLKTILDNIHDTDLPAVKTETAAIKAKTDNLPATPASSGEYTTNIGAIKAKTDNLPATPASAGEYTAAIAAIPTAPLLAANYTAPDNASIATIKAKTNLIPANPAVADEYDAALAAIQADLDNPDQYKADVSGLATQASVNSIPTTPLLAANYVAPNNSGIASILEDTGTTIPATLAGLATSAEVGAITMLDEVVVGSYTMQDILKILAAKMVGKATGGSTATITYRGVDDTSDVIIETVDSNGNRSAVTLTV